VRSRIRVRVKVVLGVRVRVARFRVIFEVRVDVRQ